MSDKPDQKVAMSREEKRAAFSLAAIYAVRMMGLFMILPVFALYANTLEYSTPFLVGIAIGIYGLTQAVLQIPFGWLSDRFGRKPVIVLGLMIFGIGSLVAASSHGIYTIIFGRALQGAGAVAGVVMALAVDLSRENQRTKMMAFIGMSIGGAFVISLIMGPVLYNHIGVPGIFIVTALLALVAIAMIVFVVPAPGMATASAVRTRDAFFRLALDPGILALNVGILLLHAILTASFVVIPYLMRDIMRIPESSHWQIYLGVMTVSLLLVMPFIARSDKSRGTPILMLAAIALLGLAEMGLAMMGEHRVAALFCLVVFFMAFNFLEASLPALISKKIPAGHKGLGMGMFSSSQFFGAFLGGALGGWVWGAYGIGNALWLCSLMAGIWLIIAFLGYRTLINIEP